MGRIKLTYAFIDASNLFYGGEKSLGWKVDMAFDLMRYFNEYSGVLILSGDGDFAIVLNYLKEKGKKITILARGERTAREIRQLAGKDFRDFKYLREILKFQP